MVPRIQKESELAKTISSNLWSETPAVIGLKPVVDLIPLEMKIEELITHGLSFICKQYPSRDKKPES